MKLIDKIEAMTKLISKIGEKVVKVTGKCNNGKFRAKYHLASGHIITRTFKINK